MKKLSLSVIICLTMIAVRGQDKTEQKESPYKARVLENTEIDLLGSYYKQEGDHAAVSGGTGTEKLTDVAPTIVISVPLNDDDVLTLDAGISSYTSASSSNINPFDGKKPADPFQATSGASRMDVYTNVTGSFSHSSDNRNRIWSAKLSLSNEFDYTSLGFGGSYAWLFNEKNTEFSLNGNVYLDTWKLLYPVELRSFTNNGGNEEEYEDDDGGRVPWEKMTGNLNYAPSFTGFNDKSRNSYSLGIGFSQILSKKLQASVSIDLIRQDGLLSTPFHRIYFADKPDTYIENFQLADDVEHLPDIRLKAAFGGRLNYFLNEIFVARTYYRYYVDDWGIISHTASIEIPVKLSSKFTIYPSYRFYSQTAADHFAGYEQHLSTEKYYTSDYDLSGFHANQYGFGISYTDVLAKSRLWYLHMKSIDLKFHHYERDSGFKANMISFGIKFTLDTQGLAKRKTSN